MAIMDVIKKNKQKKAGAVDAQGMHNVMTQASTGKAGMGRTGPAMSNIAAQTTAAAGQAEQQLQSQQFDTQRRGMAQQEQQGQLAFQQQLRGQQQQHDQQLAALTEQQSMQAQQREAEDQMASERLFTEEQTREKEMSSNFANQLADLASDRGIATNEIFQHMKRERQTLSFDKVQAGINQIGFMAAQADQQYMDEIRRIADLRNLQDEIEFKLESQRLAFGQNFEILQQQFDMKSLMAADQREFDRMLGQMNRDTAMSIVNQAANEANYRAVIQGGTVLATSVADYAIENRTTDPSTSQQPEFQGSYNTTAYAPGEDSYSTGRSGDLDYI